MESNSKKWRVTMCSLINDANSTEYIVEAATEDEARNIATMRMVNEEGDGFLLDSPAQMITVEEIK